ncbi:hypothetical protein SASPL_145009 [Salvia splendens]|uniref:TF-B3 domain-containing protein n=1 Tax=Salvia splendens TaxID=180675 RepID=A0A8X8WFU0_SALSN|nr:hypothetical protein SASPL_145009 [Salvia splendens]
MYNLIDMASQYIEGSADDGSPEGNSLLGSKDLAPNRSVKSDRSRHIWSAREEDILMATLKENYGSLKMMLNYSAIGFNSDGTYRIECDDEQWALFCKKDRHAKYMRNKPWPQYEDWKEVFGNNRANGEKRIDVSAAAGTIYGNKDEAPAADETSTHMSLQDLFPDMVFPERVLPEIIDESQSSTEGGEPGSAVDVGVGAGEDAVLKKQKVEDKMDGVITLMGQIHTDTNERLKEISNRIGYEFDLSNKRSEVFDQLKGISGLSLKLQFYISKKLVKEPELLDLFLALPETARTTFVFDLLEADEKLAITQELDALLSVIYKERYRTDLTTGYGDSDHSDAPDVDTSDDYVPTQSECSFSSDGDDYASDAGVLDDDGCPTFTVNLNASNINRTLEIPMAFWRRHVRMISLQDPVCFNVNGDSWYIILDHNETKIWVKRGWRCFKERNNLVVGVRCHFQLIDRNEVQFYVWFDRP